MLQVVILCGGTGTRLKEMTEFTPKALISIGGKPVIFHIMKHYSSFGFNSFVLALGYKQEAFKNYFAHYNEINYDLFLDAQGLRGQYQIHDKDVYATGYDIVLSDTGENTLKGGRLKRIEKYITGDTFMLTYGDAVSDVDIPELLNFHKNHGKLITITGVNPRPRFGEVIHQDGRVLQFKEKQQNSTMINGGFMVMNRGIFDYLDNDCDLELGPFERLVEKEELMVYHHTGFWRCMDTMNDMVELNKMWDEETQSFRREYV
jgi:glucose-1-phosphate cytidylyltransferase